MKALYDYDSMTVADVVGDKKFKLPKFQRNVVWNPKKRKEFIDTLRKGNPFGSILVHEEKTEIKTNDGRTENITQYLLIDGLQRVSTIRNYIAKPYDYLTPDDISEEDTLDLIKYIYDTKGINGFSKEDKAVKSNCEEIREYIYNELTNYDINDIINNQFQIFINVKNKFSLPTTTADSGNYVFKILQDFVKSAIIDDIIVPTIYYKGPSENLPDIFYNLNTGGIKLSKYETFSASWKDRIIPITDDEIITQVYAKYDNMQNKSEMDVNVTIDEIKKGVTLFEYCCAISSILRDKKYDYKTIIGDNNKSTTDPIGFDLLSLICGLNVNKAEKLDEKLVNATPEFLVKIRDIIIEAMNTIKRALSYWIKAENKKENTSDSMYMIYHMCISYIKNNYSFDFNNYTISEIGNKNWNKMFTNNLSLYYLYDTITDYWKINRQVTDLSNNINSSELLNKYSCTISKNDWKTAYEKLKEYELKTYTSDFDLKTRLFIDYLIKYKVKKNPMLTKYFKSENPEENVSIDYEHIIPVNRILRKIENMGLSKKNYPIYSLGNVCYLTSKENRAKHDDTLYENNVGRPSYSLDKDYIDFVDYPEREEISFINDKYDEFNIQYRQFLENRIDKLTEEFNDLIFDLY